VSITEGLADGAAALTKIAAGRAADRRDRRGLVGLGYGLAAAGKMIVAAAVVWPMVLFARVLDRIGKGLRGAPRDALIADGTPPEHRGRAFGFHRAADSTGAVIGPLLGLGLYELLGRHIRPLLIVAAVPAVLSVLLVRWVVDPRPAPVRTAGQAGAADRPAPFAGPLPPAFWRVTIVLTLFAVVNFTDALLLLRAAHLGLSVTGVIGVYCLYNATYALLSYPAGALSDRVPRHLVFGAGLAVFAVAYIGLGLAGSGTTVWLLLPLYGAYTALTDGVGKAWIVDLVPAAARGRALGLQQGLAGAGTIVAGVWAGLLWRGSGSGPLVASGVVAGVLAVAMLTGGRLLEART
jgi:MFS family permease